MSSKAKVVLDLPTLAAALESSRSDHGFHIVPYQEIEIVLMTTFPFKSGLAEIERRVALHRGISVAAALGPITAQSLESGVRREEQTILDTPMRSFVLASNLSFTRFAMPRSQQFHGVITLVRSLPRQILEARAAEEAQIPEEDRFVSGYSGVLAKVKGRSAHHAFDLAVSKLDLLRGIWNLAHNRRRVWGSSSDPTQPVNRIRFSRIHTVHDSRGGLATTNYWFNPEFRSESSTSLSDVEWNRMQAFLRSVQQHLAVIPYRSDVERAIVHYGRALDATDMESAFLKLWSVLEFVSGLGGEKYDKLLARTAFLFKPDRVTSLVLEHLRYQRNEAVHLGNPQSEMRPLVYQLKFYVERMIAFHMALGRHFTDLDEASRFMDLSQPAGTLRRRVELIERALKYRQIRRPTKPKPQRPRADAE